MKNLTTFLNEGKKDQEKEDADFIYNNYIKDNDNISTSKELSHQIRMDVDMSISAGYIKKVIKEYHNIDLK